MKNMKEHFVRGFIKAAMESGYNQPEAVELIKSANIDWDAVQKASPYVGGALGVGSGMHYGSIRGDKKHKTRNSVLGALLGSAGGALGGYAFADGVGNIREGMGLSHGTKT